MAKSISNYFQRKRKERLFRQWVDQGALSSEEVPLDLLEEKSTDDADMAPERTHQRTVPDYSALTDIDKGIIRLPIRYVLILISIVAALLVALAIIITVLIMGS